MGQSAAEKREDRPSDFFAFNSLTVTLSVPGYGTVKGLVEFVPPARVIEREGTQSAHARVDGRATGH